MTRRKSSGPSGMRAIARLNPKKRLASSSITPVPFETRLSRRSSIASTITKSCTSPASASASSDASPSRKAKRSLSAPHTSRSYPAQPPTASFPRCFIASKPARHASPVSTTARQNPYRGYITIIEGCDKFCSYCVVPYTRGKERSRTSASVLEEAKRIADLGYTEIQLLGQNVNSYRDPEGKVSFADLLAAVAQVPGIRRVRFTTSHPRDFTKDIVEVIDAYPTLCDHIHLPVQSGSSRILKARPREYTSDWYLDRTPWMKPARPNISLST